VAAAVADRVVAVAAEVAGATPLAETIAAVVVILEHSTAREGAIREDRSPPPGGGG